ncbi:site-specific integrase [uncultured Sunxiuqinia sp.]|uniref:site-specific integrase n=1 Tax=uncultured Sunxiuqinia sp. TaxID=1573825 RepID=UPI002AA758DC
MDGDLWIITERTKTKSQSNIPLLSKAHELIKKYSRYPNKKTEEHIFPIFTNQKMNAYLKEIADLASVDKNLTFHVARHTFATTVTLTNGVPIESVSKMLGHTNLKTTQIYVKVNNYRFKLDNKPERTMEGIKVICTSVIWVYKKLVVLVFVILKL